ncbi:glycosyltransferase [Chitinophaga rhizophila]|uniref:Glycosyl transferase family 28 n=1 Tax=Chitinophaga rhizophila TaxID=2866212 RepID=A0ABS7GEH4_9BACT|nr:glycosyltransferase [Chitinophaga rhizophila]MBW8686074.1 glycosyl transferase family 28 [Chitinophaga rhizophila]
MSTISTRKTILIVPLDWGLGHATRDIPLIHELLNAGCNVVIAAEGKHASLLQQEFPNLTILPLPGYRIEYAQKGWFFGWKIIQQIPKILHAIRYEQEWLQRVVEEHKIDAVISDNRFGLYHDKIPTVFISHQLLIKTPFGGVIEKSLQALNYRYIRRYSACWIPDYADAHNLSGILAHPAKLPDNTTYLGCLSRFEDRPDVPQQYDLLVLISGPEPQRSNLEKMILDQIKALPISALIVSGKPGTPEKKQIAPRVQQVNHMNAKELNEAMLASKMVLSRSGYTTLMDLVKLNKKAILIPTPGQSEQEYLGKFLMKKGYFYNIPQHAFNLKDALAAADKFQFKSFEHEQDMLQYKGVVRKFVEDLHKA